MSARTGPEPAESVGPCYFRDLGGGVQLTNDWGGHHWLTRGEFAAFVAGTLAPESATWRALREKGFLRGSLDFAALGRAYLRRNAHLAHGPALHLVAVTSRNNQDTPYGAAAPDPAPDADMTVATARRVARFIFESPAPELTVELRGGEPLLNWEAVEFLVGNLSEFAGAAGRKLRLGLTTNLSLLDDARLDFLAGRGVELCVPLDGPADLHDRHRAWAGGSSHAAVTRWLRAWGERHPEAPRPRAWLTVTRDTLGRAADIVEEYARLGLGELHLRPLWPLGRARSDWARLGVSAPEYLAFYEDCLGRLLAPGGPALRERTAALLLAKILRGEDPGFAELRSPYGGGLGELAYGVNGEVYLSDEGRLHGLAEGHALFRIGDADSAYPDVVGHPSVRACAAASDLEAQPMCSSCAYKPFCGVSPVYNLAAQGSLWGRNPTNARCAQYMGVFDLLFKRLREPAARAQLETWPEPSPGETGEPPGGGSQPPPAFLSAGVL